MKFTLFSEDVVSPFYVGDKITSISIDEQIRVGKKDSSLSVMNNELLCSIRIVHNAVL
jgi:hypothetical protein